MRIPKIVVDSDLFVQHLTGEREPSLLRLALQKFFCYTTVFQAVELFAIAKNETERGVIEDSMASVKVLGLNPKNSRWYGSVMRKRGTADPMWTLAGAMCLEAGLPLLTGRKELFRRFSGLTIIRPDEISRYETGEEILRAAKRATRKRKG